MLDQNLLKLLGPFPNKVSLDAEILESSDRGGYTRHKVSYSVEAGDRVTAFVLVPKRIKGGNAAIYCHHQHAGNFTLVARAGRYDVVLLDIKMPKRDGMEVLEILSAEMPMLRPRLRIAMPANRKPKVVRVKPAQSITTI